MWETGEPRTEDTQADLEKEERVSRGRRQTAAREVPMENRRIMDAEAQKRWDQARERGGPWKKWGPYLSERQWGTVREDYSENGDAWDYFPHDHSRSRA